MTVKITDKALREFIRSKLLSEEAGDDSQAEELSTPVVSSAAMDKSEPPIEAEVQVVDNELGPPVADPGYVPQDSVELKTAIGKLLDDVPPSAVPTAYKIVRKTLDNLHSVLRQRAEISPGVDVVLPGNEFIADAPLTQEEEPVVQMSMNESSPVEKLLLLISEQGLPGIRVVDAPKSATAAAGFGDEEEDQPDPDLEKMIGAQPTSAQAEKMRQDQAATDASQEKIDKEQGVVSQMLSDKSLQKRIDLAKEMFPDKADRIDNAVSQGEDLDTILSFDELERVQEELETTDVFVQSMQAGTSKFSEMSDELKSRYADVFLGGGEPMKSSVFRNLQDSAFMKFMMGLAIGPDVFDEKFVEFIISPPEDAKKIRSFLRKHTDVARIMANPTAGGVEKVLDQLREKSPAGDLVDQYKHLVTLYLANDIDFPGAKSSKFHFNKEIGNRALKKAVEGLIRRQEKKAYDNLVQLLNDPQNKKAVTGHLGKDWKVDSWQTKDEEEEIEAAPAAAVAEPKKSVTRSPGGRTFRRKRSGAELGESITPAEAILRSNAVNPDLDKAMSFFKESL